MKNQLFTVLIIAGLFLITTNRTEANGDSSFNKSELAPFDLNDVSVIYSAYKTFSVELGGTQIRTDKKGNPCQGWVTDYYQNGKVLHKGYYVDGRLKIFKNYYENGKVERNFKLNSYNKSNMKLFYADGKLKSVIEFYKGSPRKWSESYREDVQEEIYVKNK